MQIFTWILCLYQGIKELMLINLLSFGSSFEWISRPSIFRRLPQILAKEAGGKIPINGVVDLGNLEERLRTGGLQVQALAVGKGDDLSEGFMRIVEGKSLGNEAEIANFPVPEFTRIDKPSRSIEGAAAYGPRVDDSLVFKPKDIEGDFESGQFLVSGVDVSFSGDPDQILVNIDRVEGARSVKSMADVQDFVEYIRIKNPDATLIVLPASPRLRGRYISMGFKPSVEAKTRNS